ncbi:uncharacterized protein DUF4436 [Streptomyces sp. 1114.5]|uniref:DUF4436 family protein n=1 Tax=Streptomyces sp. 1114.5 TaxID=1938830 RepID=UPI000EB1FCD9|nr:DUF4436 family protein [Streptomyces sp. 1114.5]RKT19997.1 uncharacterized protein DUF4436 [Streptomyces sp. 1114.5]
MNALARLRGHRFVLAVVLLALACGTGITLYLDERETRQQIRALAVPSAADWVELNVASQDFDPGGAQLTLFVVAVPHGGLAQGPGSSAFTRQVEITVGAITRTVLRTAPGEVTAPQLVQAGLYGGTETDYPFDRYRFTVGFSASDATGAVPVGLVFGDADPFFAVHPTAEHPTADGPTTGTVVLNARATRARSTLILAWFMIAAMWALALAVMGGAEVLYRGRLGMVWPALGWMAATMFALIGMRNAAPGGPPIGSLIDYVAFFWAEAIIATSLTAAVITGTRVERRKRGAEAARAARAEPGGPGEPGGP